LERQDLSRTYLDHYELESEFIISIININIIIQISIEVGVCLMHRIESEAGLISSYLHTSPATGLGRMAALVALETSTASLTEDQQAEAKVGSMPAYAVNC